MFESPRTIHQQSTINLTYQQSGTQSNLFNNNSSQQRNTIKSNNVEAHNSPYKQSSLISNNTMNTGSRQNTRSMPILNYNISSSNSFLSSTSAMSNGNNSSTNCSCSSSTFSSTNAGSTSNTAMQQELEQQKSAIKTLQNDVFALRNIFDSELSKMKEDFAHELFAFQHRLQEQLQQFLCGMSNEMSSVKDDSPVQTPFNNSSSCPNLVAMDQQPASIQPTKISSLLPPSHSSKKPTSRGRSFSQPQHHPNSSLLSDHSQHHHSGNPVQFWSNDFLDNECGDLHSSDSWNENNSTMINSKMMKGKGSMNQGIAPHPITEQYLIHLACSILTEHGPVPVGKMGSLLHKAANDHSLPSILKERYGGLKKFLQSQPNWFVLMGNHPYNPSVALACAQPSNSQHQSVHNNSNVYSEHDSFDSSLSHSSSYNGLDNLVESCADNVLCSSPIESPTLGSKFYYGFESLELNDQQLLHSDKQMSKEEKTSSAIFEMQQACQKTQQHRQSTTTSIIQRVPSQSHIQSDDETLLHSFSMSSMGSMDSCSSN